MTLLARLLFCAACVFFGIPLLAVLAIAHDRRERARSQRRRSQP